MNGENRRLDDPTLAGWMRRADEDASRRVHPTSQPPGSTGGNEPATYRVRDRRFWADEEAADPAGTAESKPTYVARLEAQLAEKDALLKKYAGRATEAENELEAARERLAREARREFEQARRGLLASFLDVVDDLDRALAAARVTTDQRDSLLQGVELVRQNLLSRLKEHGVEPFAATGQPFDPVRHHAVSTVDVSDAAQAGRVAAVVREGYRIGDEVLRPALVAVGKL